MEKHHICPYRAGPILYSSLRKLFHNPHRITEPYLSDGATAIDIGCGMGFFTIPMSRIVGKDGEVIAVDLQPEMLGGLNRNALKSGCENITAHLCDSDALHIEQWNGTIDFALVFWMLHEVPDAERMINEIHVALAPKGKLLFVEPVVHVGRKKFLDSLSMMERHGFTIIEKPNIPTSRAAVLQKKVL